jgi:hypothetical protein
MDHHLRFVPSDGSNSASWVRDSGLQVGDAVQKSDCEKSECNTALFVLAVESIGHAPALRRLRRSMSELRLNPPAK